MFTLGVAPGDPATDSVVLWTRLAFDPTADDGAGAMPKEVVEVAGHRHRRGVRAARRRRSPGVAGPRSFDPAASPEACRPGPTTGTGSASARRRAPSAVPAPLPDGSPDRFGIAVTNCQMFETGTCAAWRHLLDEDVDLVAFLGTTSTSTRAARRDDTLCRIGGSSRSATHRLRYASYRLDTDLRNAHARFPSWRRRPRGGEQLHGRHPDPTATADVVKAQKAAAYQAWWEHMPSRLLRRMARRCRLPGLRHRRSGPLLPSRRAPGFGRTPLPGSGRAGLDYGDCEAVAGEDRTRLGAEQEAWFADAVAPSTATWNLVGNPVVLAYVNGGDTDDAYYLSTPGTGSPRPGSVSSPHWLGRATGGADRRLCHAGMVLDVHETPFDQSSPIVAPELMAPPISSVLFPDDVSGRTPQLRQQINAHGYLVVDVQADSVTARFRTLGDVADPATTISTAATWRVDAGDPVARPV
ncbi:MAG: alkaline phosphatase D family protein [Acidimicrobiales bacterium]